MTKKQAIPNTKNFKKVRVKPCRKRKDGVSESHKHTGFQLLIMHNPITKAYALENFTAMYQLQNGHHYNTKSEEIAIACTGEKLYIKNV